MKGFHCFHVVLKAKEVTLQSNQWSDESIYSKHPPGWDSLKRFLTTSVPMHSLEGNVEMALSQELHNAVCTNTGRVPACCRILNFPSPFPQQQTCIVAAASGTKGWDWIFTRVTTSIIRQWNCLGDHQMILWSWWCSGGISLKLLQCLRIESVCFPPNIHWSLILPQM